MTFIIVENLRGFFNSRPPLVVFMICLAAFAIALITFAYIVKTKDLPNPDITEDWNTFLEKLSHLKFCVSQNSTAHNATIPLVKVRDLSPGDALETIKEKIIDNNKAVEPLQRSKRAVKQQAEYKDASRDTSKTEPTVLSEDTTWSPSTIPNNKVGLINETFSLNIEFVPSPEFLMSGLKSVHLTTDMTGSMFNMKGSHKEQHIVMTVTFPFSSSECNKKNDDVCSLTILSCVTLTGPASMLPRARHLKKHTCSSEDGLSKESESLVKHMTASKLSDSSNRNWCSHGTSLTVLYSFDDSLTVLLSPEDRTVINLHLMRTSYFLFVMVVTLFCYAAVRGRPGKVKTAVYAPHDKTKAFIQP